MYVEGTLIAEGTAENPIIFTSESQTPNNIENTYLVRFNNSSSSNSVVDYCKFQYAYRGLYVNNASPTITNSEITNCYYGIYNNYANLIFHNNTVASCSYGIYNYWSDSNIRNNELDIGTYGIYNYRSSPRIKGNEIYNGAFGIRCNSYSSPQIGDYVEPGNNEVHDNFMAGLLAENNSNPFMGFAYCGGPGYNSFVNNHQDLAEVIAGANCSILAEENWWGSVNPSSGWFSGDVDYTPYLTSPPSIPSRIQKSPEETEFDAAFQNGPPSGQNTGNEALSHYKPGWNLTQKTRFIHALIYNGDPKEALKLCKDIITDYPDSSKTFFALDLAWQASRVLDKNDKNSLKEYVKYLKWVARLSSDKPLHGSAKLLLAGFEKGDGLARIDTVFNNFRSTYLAETALFQKFMFYFNDEEDSTAARAIVTEMDNLFPDSPQTKQAHHLLGDIVNDWGIQALRKTSGSMVEENSKVTPEQYQLVGAFPNPFNPSTTVRYVLPRLSTIDVTIFNLLGQKVKHFRVASQPSGIHDLVWDGTNNNNANVASGIYIIRLKATSLEGKAEVFEKSIKVTLLK